jgi:hypothetical protein
VVLPKWRAGAAQHRFSSAAGRVTYSEALGDPRRVSSMEPQLVRPLPVDSPTSSTGACAIERFHNLARDFVNALWITQVLQGGASYVIKQEVGEGVLTTSVHAELSSLTLQQQGKLRCSARNSRQANSITFHHCVHRPGLCAVSCSLRIRTGLVGPYTSSSLCSLTIIAAIRQHTSSHF